MKDLRNIIILRRAERLYANTNDRMKLIAYLAKNFSKDVDVLYHARRIVERRC